ncbi:MAG TPA: H-X9-DG-CTERM domain-containing protein, partial [Armatimonadota bacterium]|nr:H-X9-DG-CTERM domain-containing protein [Armatimonadota bacterium]
TNTSLAAMASPASLITVWEGWGKIARKNYALNTPYMNAAQAGVHPTYPGGGYTWYVYTIPTPSYFVHGRGMNFLFADGHVKFRPICCDGNYSPFAEVDADGRLVSYWVDSGDGMPYLFGPTHQLE